MKPFTDTINQLRFGALSEELTKKLGELTEVCKETGKSGELTLTIKLKPGKGGQVEVIDHVKLKTPEPERSSSIMFVGEAGLQREDPRQRKLDLQSVDTAPAKGELKTVNG